MFVSMLSKLPPVVCLRREGATGLLNEGGGSNRLPVEFPQVQTSLHNNTGSRPTTTVRSNDTLVDTPFQLISGFFHVNQGVLCC